MNKLDDYYLFQSEPTRSCLMALRDIILAQDEHVTEAWRYGMPFFYYKKKMFCYLWTDKKLKQPYLGIVEGDRINHPDLIKGNRSRMKIMLFDASKNLPIKTISKILHEAIDLYERKLNNY